MNKKIYCIRHGEVKYPLDREGRKLVYSPETPLSLLGRLQTKKIADRLKEDGVTIEVLFVSPFARTRESAEILKKSLQTPKVFIVDDLHDVYPNSWIGCPIEEYKTVEGDIYNNPQPQEQETLEHLLMRAKRGIEYIAKTGNFNSIGIVSHGDLLSGIDWVLRTPDILPSYIEMKNRFYLQKGQVAVYTIDPSLRLVDEVRLITVPEVQQSVEVYRGEFGLQA